MFRERPTHLLACGALLEAHACWGLKVAPTAHMRGRAAGPLGGSWRSGGRCCCLAAAGAAASAARCACCALLAPLLGLLPGA